MSSISISEMTEMVLKFVGERDWKQFHNAKDMAVSLNLEAAELLELTQWKNGAELEKHLRANSEQLADELADVLFWVLEISHHFGIDLGEAFKAKMIKNAAKYPVEKAKGKAKKYTEI